MIKTFILFIPSYPYSFIVPFSMVLGLIGGGYFLFHDLKSIAGWSILSIFGAILPAYLSGIKDEEAVMVINQEGITDRRLGVGTILWEDIVDAVAESKYNNNYICITVRNRDKYLSRLPANKRTKYQENAEIGFQRFNISLAHARDDILMALDAIRKEIESRQKTSES